MIKKYFNCKGHNYRYIWFIVLGLILGSFFASVLNNTVKADTITYITIEDFDSYASGVTTGTNAYLTWWGKAGTYLCQNSVYKDSPNSLRITQTATASSGYCYFNLTEDMVFTGYTMWFRVGSTANEMTIEWEFFNDTSVEIMNFVFQYLGNGDFRVYDYGLSSYVTIHGSLTADTWYQVCMQNNHSIGSAINTVYYCIKNTTGGILADDEIASKFSEEWGVNRTLHQIRVKESGQNEAKYHYFDLLNLTSYNYGTETGGVCDLSGTYVSCSGGYGMYGQILHDQYVEYEFCNEFTGTIVGVSLPISVNQWGFSDDLSYYTAYINSYPLGNPTECIESPYGYELRWCGFEKELNYQKPLISFKCNNFLNIQSGMYWYGIGMTNNACGGSRSHNISSYYVDNQLNGDVVAGFDISCCLYYDQNDTSYQTPDIPDDQLDDLKDKWGDPNYNYTFIIFDGGNIECFYGIGSNPILLFYVTDEYLNNTNYYGFAIRRRSDNRAVYFGQIDVYDSNRSGKLKLNDYVFGSVDSYYIELYNFSDYGTIIDTYLYTSFPVQVCDVSGESGGGVDTGVGITIPNLRGTMYGGLIGAIIVGICMIIPMRIQKGLHMKQKLPSFVYVFLGALGIVIATILPFFDVWVLAFLIIISFLYIGARYLLKSGGTEAEE